MVAESAANAAAGWQLIGKPQICETVHKSVEVSRTVSGCAEAVRRRGPDQLRGICAASI
jgi:hypothetical protein